MLPATVRRAAAPVVTSMTAVAPMAAAVGVSRPFRHQRRCSSSKPSSSDNGPKDIPGQSAAAVPATTSSSSRAGEAKAGPEKRKRRTKDAASQKLPSVPSTQHLSQEALGLSTFFSLHRPISVTSSMPKSITDDAFAAIFDLGTRAPSTKDVISTLSRTADELDGAMASMTIGSEAEAGANGDPVRKIDFQHADGSESSVYVQLNAMAGQFVPFRPPPAPEAQTEAAAAAQRQQQVATLLGESTETDPHHRVYKALFTIEESTDADGQIRVVAHSPRIVRGDGRPRTFLERMARRQLMFDDAQAAHQAAGPTMQALSVRRQRKLKMKKQKYKKLMKRTRNLRRKLDRL